MNGIVGYGSYLPHYRIKIESIAKEWGDDPAAIKRGLQLFEKTVPGLDEDTITISVEAAKNALKRAEDWCRVYWIRISSLRSKTKRNNFNRCSGNWT
jgi:3-hydroxy-3-methylglutaryl CoA synthase